MKPRKTLISVSFILLICSSLYVLNVQFKKEVKYTSNLKKESYENSFNFFVENLGQLTDSIAYVLKIENGNVYITKEDAIYYFFKQRKAEEPIIIKESVTGRLILEGKERLETSVNYFKGNVVKEWKTNIPCFREIALAEIEPGIYLTLKAVQNNFEKIYTVLPGSNPEEIKIHIENSNSSRITSSGELEFSKNTNSFSFTKPIAYQTIKGKKVSVKIAYVKENENYGFKLGNYNEKYPLIIDPLINSTYFGGSGIEQSYEIIQDEEGNIFVCGYTSSQDLPVTPNTYQSQMISSYPGTDIFIAKFNSDLSELIALTFIGGTYDEYINDITIDQNNSIVICGNTRSSDFPTTEGAYLPSTLEIGYVNGYVSVFSNDLTQLEASTCIGNKNERSSVGKVLSNNNNIYVLGSSPSIDTLYENGGEFLATFDNELTEITNEVLLEELHINSIEKILFDNNNLLIAGTTVSPDFPVTNNAYQSNFLYIGGFVMRLDTNFELISSTVFGGEHEISIGSMFLNSEGNIYISGLVDTSHYYPLHPPNNFTIIFDSTLSNMLDTINNERIYFGIKDYFYGLKDYYGFSDHYIEENKKDGTLGAFRTNSNYELYLPTQYYSEREFSIHKYSKDLSKDLVKTYFGPYWYTHSTPNIFPLKNGNILISVGAISENLPVTVNSWNTAFIGGEYGLIGPYVGDIYLAILDSNLSDNITAIYASADSGGIISPSGVFEIEDSLSLSFTLIPDEGKYVKQVWIDHQAVGAINYYEFINVKEDHYIQVEFDTIPNSINKLDNSDFEIKCYPNPFTNYFTIEYKIEKSADILIQAYDITGKKIKDLYFDKVNPGKQTFQSNDFGFLNQGLYFINFKIDNKSKTIKLIKK